MSKDFLDGNSERYARSHDQRYKNGLHQTLFIVFESVFGNSSSTKRRVFPNVTLLGS